MSASQSQLPPWWFPILFVGMWLFVSAILAHLSRWPIVARRFLGGQRPRGRVLRGQVVSIGWVNENNITYMIPTEAGLYLYAMFLFRFMRPPILLPWREVVYESSHKLLWMRYHRLRIASLTTLQVKDNGFKELAPHLPMVPSISPE